MADRIKNYQQEADQISTLKEIRTDLGVTPSSYTPDATVVTKDRVVTFAQAEEELVVLSDIEKGVKQQIADVDIAQKDISNIKALLQGHLYDYQTDTNSAYTKTVPSGAMPYAGLEQIGGKTVVWNQLVDSGTTSVVTISGHKYYTLINGTASIVTADGTAISVVDDTADMVCDLTLMFGSGNEPSTTADFTAIFGATHYAYNEGTLLSAGVTEVVSKDSNDSTLQTYPIPTAIRNLEGYGWSAGTAYNYVDFERKVFVQNVGSYTFVGTDFYGGVTVGDVATTFAFNLPSNRPKKGVAYNAYGDYICEGEYTHELAYHAGHTNELLPLGIYAIALATSENYVRLYVPRSLNLTDHASVQAYYTEHPFTIHYELATPIETDISEYLTDDNLIQVESGGTLTFPNSNGTDYQIPVPSDVTYMIDLQEAINNG